MVVAVWLMLAGVLCDAAKVSTDGSVPAPPFNDATTASDIVLVNLTALPDADAAWSCVEQRHFTGAPSSSSISSANAPALAAGHSVYIVGAAAVTIRGCALGVVWVDCRPAVPGGPVRPSVVVSVADATLAGFRAAAGELAVWTLGAGTQVSVAVTDTQLWGVRVVRLHAAPHGGRFYTAAELDPYDGVLQPAARAAALAAERSASAEGPACPATVWADSDVALEAARVVPATAVRLVRSNTTHGQPVHFHVGISASAIALLVDADASASAQPLGVVAAGKIALDLDGCRTGVDGAWDTSASLSLVRFGMAYFDAFATSARGPARPPPRVNDVEFYLDVRNVSVAARRSHFARHINVLVLQPSANDGTKFRVSYVGVDFLIEDSTIDTGTQVAASVFGAALLAAENRHSRDPLLGALFRGVTVELLRSSLRVRGASSVASFRHVPNPVERVSVALRNSTVRWVGTAQGRGGHFGAIDAMTAGLSNDTQHDAIGRGCMPHSVLDVSFTLEEYSSLVVDEQLRAFQFGSRDRSAATSTDHRLRYEHIRPGGGGGGVPAAFRNIRIRFDRSFADAQLRVGGGYAPMEFVTISGGGAAWLTVAIKNHSSVSTYRATGMSRFVSADGTKASLVHTRVVVGASHVVLHGEWQAGARGNSQLLASRGGGAFNVSLEASDAVLQASGSGGDVNVVGSFELGTEGVLSALSFAIVRSTVAVYGINGATLAGVSSSSRDVSVGAFSFRSVDSNFTMAAGHHACVVASVLHASGTLTGAVSVAVHRSVMEFADSTGATIAEFRSRNFDGGAIHFAVGDSVLRAGSRGGLKGSLRVLNLAVGSSSGDTTGPGVDVCVHIHRSTVRLPRLAAFVVLNGATSNPPRLLVSVVDSTIASGATSADRTTTAIYFSCAGGVDTALANSSIVFDNSTVDAWTAGDRRRVQLLYASNIFNSTIAVVRGSALRASSWGLDVSYVLATTAAVVDSTIVILDSAVELYGGRGQPRLLFFEVASRSDIAVIGSRVFMASVDGRAFSVKSTMSQSTLSVTSSLVGLTGHDFTASSAFIFGTLASSAVAVTNATFRVLRHPAGQVNAVQAFLFNRIGFGCLVVIDSVDVTVFQMHGGLFNFVTLTGAGARVVVRDIDVWVYGSQRSGPQSALSVSDMRTTLPPAEKQQVQVDGFVARNEAESPPENTTLRAAPWKAADVSDAMVQCIFTATRNGSGLFSQDRLGARLGMPPPPCPDARRPAAQVPSERFNDTTTLAAPKLQVLAPHRRYRRPAVPCSPEACAVLPSARLRMYNATGDMCSILSCDADEVSGLRVVAPRVDPDTCAPLPNHRNISNRETLLATTTTRVAIANSTATSGVDDVRVIFRTDRVAAVIAAAEAVVAACADVDVDLQLRRRPLHRFPPGGCGTVAASRQTVTASRSPTATASPTRSAAVVLTRTPSAVPLSLTPTVATGLGTLSTSQATRPHVATTPPALPNRSHSVTYSGHHNRRSITMTSTRTLPFAHAPAGAASEQSVLVRAQAVGPPEVTAVATASALVVTVSAFGGPADAADAQTIAFGMQLACDAGSGGDGGGGPSLLSPLTSVGDPAWRVEARALAGSGLIVAALTLVHSTVVGIVALVTKSKTERPWVAAAAKLRFPALPLATALTLSQGFLVSSARLVADGDGPSAVVGAAALFASCAAGLFLVRDKCARLGVGLTTADSLEATATTFLRHCRWRTTTEALVPDGGAIEPTAPTGGFLRKLLTPVGFWRPGPFARSWGPVFGSFSPPAVSVRNSAAGSTPAAATFPDTRDNGSALMNSTAPLLTVPEREVEVDADAPKKTAGLAHEDTLPHDSPANADVAPTAALVHVVRPLAFAVVAALPFDRWGACDVQFGLTAALALGSAGLVLWRMPYRWAPGNGFALVAFAALGVAAGGRVSSVALAPATTRVVLVVCGAVVAAGKVLALGVTLWERRAKKAAVAAAVSAATPPAAVAAAADVSGRSRGGPAATPRGRATVRSLPPQQPTRTSSGDASDPDHQRTHHHQQQPPAPPAARADGGRRRNTAAPPAAVANPLARAAPK